MAKTYLFWDPLEDNIVREYDEAGVVTAEYTTEPGLYGNVINQNRGGAESQFHYDALGSTLGVTDENQNLTDTIAYAAFGEVTERTGTTEDPFLYIGQKGYYRDGVTAQYAVRSTQYGSAQNRWLQHHQTRLTGINLFVYLHNNPVKADDRPGDGRQRTGSIEAPSDPSKCKIGLDCNQVASSEASSGPYHCGIVISYYNRAGTVVVDRLHSLGFFNPKGRAFGCHVLTNPPSIIGTFHTYDVTEHPKSDCDCILATAAIVNAHIGTNNYRAAPVNDACSRKTECNSNYISKCLLRHCGINKKQPDPAPGENHRMWRV